MLRGMVDHSAFRDDCGSDDGEDVALAQRIFSYRPTATSNLAPKGGLKYSEFRGTEQEALRLRDYYNSRDNALSSLKVRKLNNLGLAEWIPELFVAKIIDQGKFMQTFGFPHEKGFHALYPEEALYLLDVGDIELKYKEARISLQDAFMLLCSASPGGSLCTLDEYSVYAHLCRMGYKIQRYAGPDVDDDLSSTEEIPEGTSAKREGPVCEGEPENSKKLKFDSDVNLEPLCLDKSQEMNADEIDRNICRGWWCKNVEHEVLDLEKTKCIDFSVKVSIPNFGDHNSTLVLHQIEQSLVPQNTCSWLWEVEDIWYNRFSKDYRDTNQPNSYSFPKHIDLREIGSRAENWSHFKTLLEKAIEDRKTALTSLSEQMHCGDIKPLVHPRDTSNIHSILRQLKLFNDPLNFCSKETANDTYRFRFNVYNPDVDKPFRKTRPGKPLIRVCVVTHSDPLPDFASVTELNEISDGVPVKIALVEAGKVLFLGFDNISIPIDLLVSAKH